MFKFRKKAQQVQPDQPNDQRSWFSRLTTGLKKTKDNLTEGVSTLFLGRKKIDEDLLEELETQLLLADIGVETTEQIISDITDSVDRKKLTNPEALLEELQRCLVNILNIDPLKINDNKKPHVILMVGVNGAGKTTTIKAMATLLEPPTDLCIF